MLPDPFQASLDSFTRPTQAQATATPMDLEVVPATQNPWGDNLQPSAAQEPKW